MSFTTLITPEELAALLSDNRADVLVLDCSFDLTNPEAGLRGYRDGHLPGAVHLDLDRDMSGSKTGSNGRHPLPSREIFVTMLRRAGANNDTQLVAYDSTGGMFASRLWWLARWVGHRAVAVLDGGFPAWCEAELPLQTLAHEGRAPGHFSAREPLVTIVGYDTVLENIDTRSRVVLDARAVDRFRGENETLDAVGGHIPQARNRFFKDNLDADGRFKTAEQLHAEFSRIAGTTEGADIIAQCGSGVTACHNLLALEAAGMTGAALYPGSWSEWSSRAGAPIATGE